MHYLYFTKVPKEDAKTSEEARAKAHEILEAQSFCYADGGYFAGGKCDWYVIGGRWSGTLNKGYEEFFKRVQKELPNTSEWGLSTEEIDKNTLHLQTIWQEFGGIGTHPYGRNSYDHDGYEDDAQPITKEMLAMLKERYSGENQLGEKVACFDGRHEEENDVAELGEDSIGDWLVVIDYHS